ncbi:hypothetical protein C8Q74DRAFT_1289426 [Fomes fomentarius]|nr:hypothetical protein C8Q74DRAFT_1289400 [Fomes fomentarius]KAI0762290.1 hypothetical protein C8Q74DRAFT_1289426 [Fomes fomentarius]
MESSTQPQATASRTHADKSVRQLEQHGRPAGLQRAPPTGTKRGSEAWWGARTGSPQGAWVLHSVQEPPYIGLRPCTDH